MENEDFESEYQSLRATERYQQDSEFGEKVEKFKLIYKDMKILRKRQRVIEDACSQLMKHLRKIKSSPPSIKSTPVFVKAPFKPLKKVDRDAHQSAKKPKPHQPSRIFLESSENDLRTLLQTQNTPKNQPPTERPFFSFKRNHPRAINERAATSSNSLKAHSAYGFTPSHLNLTGDSSNLTAFT